MVNETLSRTCLESWLWQLLTPAQLHHKSCYSSLIAWTLADLMPFIWYSYAFLWTWHVLSQTVDLTPHWPQRQIDSYLWCWFLRSTFYVSSAWWDSSQHLSSSWSWCHPSDWKSLASCTVQLRLTCLVSIWCFLELWSAQPPGCCLDRWCSSQGALTFLNLGTNDISPYPSCLEDTSWLADYLDSSSITAYPAWVKTFAPKSELSYHAMPELIDYLKCLISLWHDQIHT